MPTVQNKMVRAYAEREGISLDEAQQRMMSVIAFWRDWVLDGNALKLRGFMRIDLWYHAPTYRAFLKVRWCRRFLRVAREHLQSFSWNRDFVEEADPWRRYTD